MKHLIILGDGMADYPVDKLGGLTPLQYADTPYMDRIARLGRCGTLITIPEGYPPGSDVAITSILGYDLKHVYEGRGPLEAAGRGYDMRSGDLALRCNFVTLEKDIITNHHGGHISSEEGNILIRFLQQNLDNDSIGLIPGIQYRHLMIIKGGNKNIKCRPPHDINGYSWRDCLPTPLSHEADSSDRLSPKETVDLITSLITDSHSLLETHPINQIRKASGIPPANCLWPWGGGYRPEMPTLRHRYNTIKSGAVISAVDLIRGIGRNAGLDIIDVPGATGSADTNYHGKAYAAIDALRNHDFVFLHVEASDEASHDGDIFLKIKTIENLDKYIVRPIFEAVKSKQVDFHEDVSIAILPDHHTSVELRTHTSNPVPFTIWHPGISPDTVSAFDEYSCLKGSFHILAANEFMEHFMNY